MDQTCVEQIEQDEFQHEVLEHPGAVLVDFYTEWCPPCKIMAPVLESLCASRPALKICKVDAEANADLSVKLGISGVPTFVLYRDGQIVGRTSGASSQTSFSRWIDESLSK